MILDRDKIQKINLFESLTNAKVKELTDEDKITIIVDEGEIGKAIGKNGKNIKMFENMLHKKIKIVEFSKDPLKFTANFIHPAKAELIQLNNNNIEIKAKDRKTKGLLIGRERKNLNELEKLLKEYFKLNIKII